MAKDTIKTVPETRHDEDIETAAYASPDAIYIDESMDRKLFWSVNRRILVCMLGTYFCQSLDKGTLQFASVMGIREDAGLDHGQRFPWLGTILYMGVLVGEWPANFLLQKLPTAKFLAANVFLWGVVVACSAAATSFAPLMVVRFFLGFFEACVQPTFILMTGMWIGGILAWGITHYTDGVIYSWQLLFLILGVATCAWAVFVAWWLPDSPMKAKCFTEDKKRLLVERVRANETGIQNRTYKRYQIVEAVADPVIWCYVLLQLTSTLVIGGLGVFSGLIISSFGFNYLQTQLLNIAQGALTIFVMVGSAWLVSKTKQTALVMHGLTVLPIIGTAIIYSFPQNPSNKIGLLFAFYCTQFYVANGNLIFSLLSRNIAGQTKKSTTLTITFVAWAAGNMTAPQIFQDSDASRYRNGFTAHFCLYVLFNIVLAIMRLLLTRRNIGKRRDAATAATDIAGALSTSPDHLKGGSRVGEVISHANAFADLTDKENPNFRYDI